MTSSMRSEAVHCSLKSASRSPLAWSLYHLLYRASICSGAGQVQVVHALEVQPELRGHPQRLADTRNAVSAVMDLRQ